MPEKNLGAQGLEPTDSWQACVCRPQTRNRVA